MVNLAIGLTVRIWYASKEKSMLYLHIVWLICFQWCAFSGTTCRVYIALRLWHEYFYSINHLKNPNVGQAPKREWGKFKIQLWLFLTACNIPLKGQRCNRTWWSLWKYALLCSASCQEVWFLFSSLFFRKSSDHPLTSTFNSCSHEHGSVTTHLQRCPP